MSFAHDTVGWSAVCDCDIFCSCSRTAMSAESDSDVMFYLQNYQVLVIDRSLVYLILFYGLDSFTSDR